MYKQRWLLRKLQVYATFHRQKKSPAVSIWLFAFCWSRSGAWKRGPNRIREHWFWRLRYLLHTSKCTFMSWLLGSLGLPSRRKDTHQLMSRVDYIFNQCSVVSFVIKKLYVYLFMVKQCTYLFILMYFMQIYFHLLWSENKFTDFVVFLNFLLTLNATWIIENQNSEKIQRVKIRLNLKANDMSDY